MATDSQTGRQTERYLQSIPQLPEHTSQYQVKHTNEQTSDSRQTNKTSDKGQRTNDKNRLTIEMRRIKQKAQPVNAFNSD